MSNTPSDDDLINAYDSAAAHGNERDVHVAGLRAVLAKWGTPQPVVREPLTDEQIAEMMRDTWGCASIAPRHALEFARAVERAHGITGGQHGD